jgi:hypothetical protein
MEKNRYENRQTHPWRHRSADKFDLGELPAICDAIG